jgi:hypothetical protein
MTIVSEPLIVSVELSRGAGALVLPSGSLVRGVHEAKRSAAAAIRKPQ